MATLITDLIVYFRGASATGPLQPEDVFPTSRLAVYNGKAPQANRQVVRIGSTTNTIREASAGLIEDTMNKMRAALRDQILGRIFIYGSSSGGRNAIDLAVKLSNNNKLTNYLGVLDAAFFPNETTTKAPSDPLKDAPVFDVPFLTVFKKQNFYQLAGNDTKMTFHGMMFTSEMPNQEIHGKISGFNDNVDLTDETVQAAGIERFRAARGASYHGKCIELAVPKAHSAISLLLNNF